MDKSEIDPIIKQAQEMIIEKEGPGKLLNFSLVHKYTNELVFWAYFLLKSERCIIVPYTIQIKKTIENYFEFVCEERNIWN